MQDVSINFGMAATAAGRMWMPPRLRTDWADDGYDGDHTIDDLGRQMGEWSVSHHLDDGLPDEVSFVAGLGTAELTAELGGAPSAGGAGLSARAYFSPLRTDSPVAGFDRDIAPVTLDVGLVGAAGPEYVRVFTGQMVDIPVDGQVANLSAISANRLRLSTLVHPPAVAGRYEGARADWVVSYAFAASGVYLSPPPQPGCRLWMPMHGSIHSFIPSANADSINTLFFTRLVGTGFDDQTWITGPYHLAPDLFFGPNDPSSGANGSNRIDINSGKSTQLADGDDLSSQAGLRGKLEFWVFGDSITVNDFPASSATLASWMSFTHTNTNSSFISMSLPASASSATDRHPRMNVSDNGTSHILQHSQAVPRDGQWHKVGMAYDFSGANHKRWVYLDGVVETDNTALSTSGFPAADTPATNSPRLRAYLPIAEVQLTTGVYGNPDNFPWVHDTAFTPDVRMTPSLINLVNVVETQPREAWELIGSFARAELAMLRTDENDVVTYLGPAWWVKDAQQVVSDRYSTLANAGRIPVARDPSKIRNSVRVSYTLAQSATTWTIVVGFSSEAGIPPGITTFILPLSTAAVELRGFTVALNDGTGSQPTDTHYITLNTNSAGTGSYATVTQAAVVITSWHPGAATIQITNSTGAYLYIANDNGWPGLALAGKPHYTSSTFAQDQDDSSILERRERSLTLTDGAVQREVDGRRLARNLRANLMRPIVTIGKSNTGIELAGNPARQPGDLVEISDRESGIGDSLWRVQTVEHTGRGAKYRNAVTVRRTMAILVIGEGRIGRTVIGPNSRTEEPPYGI